MEKIEFWREKIEKRLSELLNPKGPKELVEAMKYYPMQKGKRIRPLFTVAVANTLGGDEDDAITVGCGIELIHNYSLIHDDLPCMDNDAWRRGLPTCHIKFGEAMALLAGDALLTYTFEVLSNVNNYKTLSCEEILEVNRIIAVKAGSDGMVGGQALDIKGHQDLYEVSVKKTGALFEACFMCGAIVAKKRELLTNMERLGRKVGLLFQMVDDYLDKDGFYKKLGEGLKTEIKKLYEEIKEDKVFREIKELMYLLDIVYKRVT